MFYKLVLVCCVITTSIALQCYKCDSIVSGDDCNDSAENPGQLTECPENENKGCFISEVLAGETAVVTRGCTGLDSEDEYKCEVHIAGEHALTFCNCHGDECNKDWSSAAGPGIKCYNCNSVEEGNAGQCDETHPGALEECPIERRKGCFISKATYGGSTVFERGCTEVTDPAEYLCRNVQGNGDTLHYCNCLDSECNKNWDSAGDTTTTN